LTDAVEAAGVGSLIKTTIDTLASQTSLTLTDGSADDDAYNGCVAIVTDQTTGTQKCISGITDYTGTSKTVTLGADPGIFTMEPGDTVEIMPSVSMAFIIGEGAEGATEIDANVTKINDQTVTAAAPVIVGAYVGNATAAIVVDGSGYVTPTAASKIGYALAETGMDLVVLPADIITDAAVKVDAVTKIQNGLAVPGSKMDLLDTILEDA
jgi:hypothetical protein